MYNTPWTERELSILCKLWFAGRNDEWIARSLDRSESAVKAMRVRRGLVSRRRTQRQWGRDELRLAKEARARGNSVAEIAEDLERTNYSVYSALNRAEEATQ